jgi:hypothetical protein
MRCKIEVKAKVPDTHYQLEYIHIIKALLERVVFLNLKDAHSFLNSIKLTRNFHDKNDTAYYDGRYYIAFTIVPLEETKEPA